jgi:recombination associated protein RdgC
MGENSMANQQQVEIAAKLYKCRDQQVYIRGEGKFVSEVAEYKPVFDEVMLKHSCSVIEALIKLLERAKGHQEEGLLMHLLNAVACELAEPKYTLCEQTKKDRADQRVKSIVDQLIS